MNVRRILLSLHTKKIYRDYTHWVLRICWISRIWNSWAEASSSESKQRCIVKTVYVYVKSRGCLWRLWDPPEEHTKFSYESLDDRVVSPSGYYGSQIDLQYWTMPIKPHWSNRLEGALLSSSPADHNEDPDWVSSTQKIIITRKMPQKVT